MSIVISQPGCCASLHPRRTGCNVIFIGETGSGKSSIINLIAGHSLAVVARDSRPCTSAFASYDVSIKGRTYRLWDTPGLGGNPYSWLSPDSWVSRRSARATKDSVLKRFLRERRRRGELDLLVLCVRGGRANAAMSRTYSVFCRASRQVVIPVVIAVTHLERAQPTMEQWWLNNERELGRLGLLFDGHACLTCLSPHHRRWASQQDICALISAEYPQFRRNSGWIEREYLEYPNRVQGCTIC